MALQLASQKRDGVSAILSNGPLSVGRALLPVWRPGVHAADRGFMLQTLQYLHVRHGRWDMLGPEIGGKASVEAPQDVHEAMCMLSGPTLQMRRARGWVWE